MHIRKRKGKKNVVQYKLRYFVCVYANFFVPLQTKRQDILPPTNYTDEHGGFLSSYSQQAAREI